MPNKSLVIVLFWEAFNLLDAVTTIVGVHGMGASEMNPVPANLGWAPFLAFKLLLAPCVVYLLLRRVETVKRPVWPAWAIVVGQAAVVGWNVSQLAKLVV